MAIYKKGDSYFIDYWYQGRRYREKGGRTKREALDALATVRADILRGEFRIKKQAKVRFDVYSERYMKEYSIPKKRSWRRDKASLVSLRPFFGSISMGKINRFLIEQYQAKRTEGGLKPGTVNRETALLSHIFTRAVEEGIVQNNPVRLVKPLKVNTIMNRFLSSEEIARLLDASSDEFRPVVFTAVNTGMREGELLALKWANVDLTKGVIRVTQTKSGKDRWIPINDHLREVLAGLKGASSSEYVFASKRTGTRVKKIESAWKGALRRSGIAPCRFHDLRHAFASHLVASGADLVTVKELLGHQDIRMTMIYAHTAPQYKREAVARLNGLFEGKTRQNIDTESAA
jgi:integrase